MSKAILSRHIVVIEFELASVRDALSIHIEATRAEDGCIVFNVEEHVTEVGRFDVYEEFEDSDAFSFHQKGPRESDKTARNSRHRRRSGGRGIMLSRG